MSVMGNGISVVKTKSRKFMSVMGDAQASASRAVLDANDVCYLDDVRAPLPLLCYKLKISFPTRPWAIWRLGSHSMH
eukprot:1158683-Amphidinium_carterae.1